MKEKILPPSELKATYIHNRENEKRKKTWEWLDQMLSEEKHHDVPTITAVSDPDTGELLVYNGNIRVAHATQNNYNLKTGIISDQDDLDEYLKDNPKLWFGITDFRELIKYIRIYAKYPEENEEVPEEMSLKIRSKHQEWEYKQRKEFFGWYDDD